MFPNSIGGRKGPKADTRDWKKLCKQAGVTTHYVRYQMKHTGVTNMLTHGVDDRTTATLSGHRDPVVTLKHYARPTSSSVRKALEAQDSLRPTKERIEELDELRAQTKALQSITDQNAFDLVNTFLDRIATAEVIAVN